MTASNNPSEADRAFRRRMRRRRVWVWSLIACATAAVAVGGVALAYAMTSRLVIAYVSCSSGQPVTGVWMEGTRLGHVATWEVNSGFAQVSALPSPSNDVKAVWYRHFGGGVRLDVGCGSTSLSWLRVAHSEPTSLDRMIVMCDDQSAVDGDYTCKVFQG